MEDVGVTQNEFNIGQQMLSLGIVLFEILSNMTLYRVGPDKWLTLQLFLFWHRQHLPGLPKHLLLLHRDAVSVGDDRVRFYPWPMDAVHLVYTNRDS